MATHMRQYPHGLGGYAPMDLMDLGDATEVFLGLLAEAREYPASREATSLQLALLADAMQELEPSPSRERLYLMLAYASLMASPLASAA